MVRVVVDEPTLSRLCQMEQSAELCDAGGRVIGRFTPLIDLERALRSQPPISPEELERRQQEPRRPLADIMTGLQERS